MKKNTFLLLICLLLICSSFLNNSKKISICMVEYNYLFTPQKETCSNTITKKIEDGREIKIVVFDYKGKMHLKCFKNKKKIEERDYINSFDLLKKYISKAGGTNGIQNVKVYEYYQSLRSGTWFFYDLKGKFLYKKI